MADVDPELSGPDTDDDDTPTPTPPPAAPKPKDAPVVEDTDDAAKPDAPKDPGNDLQAQALRKANREAAERRTEIKRLQAQIEELQAASATEQEKALIAARREAAEAKDAELRPAVVRANANAALSAAGITDPGVRKRLLALIDVKSVEIGEDGDVVSGLDEQIEALKADLPTIFTPPAPRVPTPAQVDAGDKKPPAREKTVAEQLAERLGLKA